RESLVCINDFHVTDTHGSLDHVEQCAQSYPTESCRDYFDQNPTARCVQLPGPGAIGSRCATAVQCASVFCAVGANQICGTCQPQPVIGDACVESNDCGKDLTCAIPSGSSSGTCVQFVQDGMPCLTGTAPCVSGDSCV